MKRSVEPIRNNWREWTYRFGTGSNKLSISVMVWSSPEVAVGGEKNAKPNKEAFNSVLPPCCQTITLRVHTSSRDNPSLQCCGFLRLYRTLPLLLPGLPEKRCL